MLMKKMFKASVVLAIAVLLSGCASGTKLSLLAQEEWQMLPGKSQIVVYRDQYVGLAYTPTIRIDGRETGNCVSQGVFVIDVEPGDYEVSAKTASEKKLQVNVPKNRRIYVRCAPAFGTFLLPPKLELVSNLTGETETSNLSFTGRF